MASGRRQGRTRAGDKGGQASANSEALGGLTRVAILGIWLLLITYTGFAITRASRTVETPGSESMSAQALAARLDGEVRAIRGGLAAAQELAARERAAPLDAAEAALKSIGRTAEAVAIIGPDGVRAVAGASSPSDWVAVSQAARSSGQPFWLGRADDAVYAVMQGPRGVTATRLNLAPLLTTGPRGQSLAIATADGRILASAGLGGAAPGASLKSTLGVGPGAGGGRTTSGQLANGTGLGVAQRPLPGIGLVAVAAQPASSAPLWRNEMARFNIVALGAPWAVGLVLTLLLLGQSRRTAEAQAAQADVEERFRMAVEAARCGIWEWDLEEDQVFMSDVTGAILGWGGGGLIPGDKVLDRIAPEHVDRVRQALLAARSVGAFDVSFRVPGIGGPSTWVDARGQAIPSRRAGDPANRIVGVALDVTEERMAQARAQAAENRLRDAIDSVSEAFVLWDRHARLLMCNKSYRSYFGLEAKLLKPGSPRDMVNRLVRLAIRQENPSPDGLAGVREAELNDGRWIQISEHRTADGGMVMTAADITAMKTQDEARRQNETALQKVVDNLEQSKAEMHELARKYESEKLRAEAANRAKSEFLANMSHELRTPLNAINGFSEIMVGEMYGSLGDPRYKEYSQDILSSGQHLLALINDILDMAKIEAGKMNLRFEPSQFEEIAEDAVRLVHNRAEAAGLELVVELPTLPDIDIDYRAAKQILLNLLSNALKFTPRGGRITVRAQTESGPGGDRLRVSVEDTGIGIGKDDLARLAQPFQQIESQHSKTQQGTGLGLALTKSLVEMHGGALKLESEPGVGTTVSFTMPLRQELQTGTFAA